MKKDMLPRLKKEYENLDKFDNQFDYAHNLVNSIEMEPSDNVGEIYWDIVYSVAPYYCGFEDETDEEFTKRKREELYNRFKAQNIDLNHFSSSEDFAETLLDDYMGDEDGYINASDDIINSVQWYFDDETLHAYNPYQGGN